MANLRSRNVRAAGAKILGLGFKDRMRSVAAAGVALSLAVTGTVVIQSESNIAQAQTAGSTPSVENAIEATGTAQQTQSYSGTAWIDREGGFEDLNKGDSAIPGATVYLQWMNGKGIVSPVYYTTTDSEGKFAFDLSKPVVDASGAEHKFQLAGDPEFRVRTWIDNPDPEKYSVVRTGDTSSARFHNRIQRTNESWDFTAGINRIVNGQMVLQERPNYEGWLAKPKDQRTTSGTADGFFPKNGSYGAVDNYAMAWWENYQEGGTLAGEYSKGPADRAATEVTMVGSYLNDDVARQLDQWKNANKGYTPDAFKEAQREIIAAYNAEHGEGAAIAETVEAPVADDGSYYLPFQGLWGANRNNRGAGISAEEYGKLVPVEQRNNSNITNWNGLPIIGSKSRHINMDYLYIYPEIEGYDVWMNDFQTNMFDKPGRSINLTAAGGQNVDRIFFSLLTPAPMHEILEYNNTDKPAKPGDTATSQTQGLSPFTKYVIQWSRNGEPIEGTECEVTSDANGTLPSCDFTVPDDITETTTFTSIVYAANPSSGAKTDALLADSMVVEATNQADEFEPAYEDVTGQPGETVTVDAPTFTNEEGETVEAPEGTTFAIDEENLPEGLTPDDVSIDETGKITVNVPADAAEGTQYDIPVIVTYPDESTDNVSATVTVDPASDFAPVAPGATLVTPEEPAVSDPITFEGEQPEGPKFAIDPEWTAPAGYTVEVDENTGVVTVTAPAELDADTVEEFEVPVVVSYPNNPGAEDDVVNVPFQLDTDGDGEPDVTDDDDDNDGFTDEEEEEAGTNPKDPEDKPSVDETAPAITPIDDQTVETGSPITPVIVETDDPEATITVEGLPEGVEFNEETGEISGTPTTPGEYTVTVTATDEDGNYSTETFTITVKDPEVDNPDWNDGSGEPGEEVVLPNNGGDTTGNETVEVEGPGTAEIDEDGNLVVTPDEDANPGDEIVVTVKDEDGEVIDTVTVTVEEPADETAPAITPIDDQAVETGSPITPVIVETDDPEATITVEGLPEGVEFNEETGEISGTPTTPGEYTVTVTATDENGNSSTETFTITVKDPEVENPDWNDSTAEPGEEIELPNNGGDTTGNETVEVEGPGEAHIDEEGNLVVTPNEDANPGDEVVVTVKDEDGEVIDVVTVTVEQPDDVDAPAITPIDDQAVETGSPITPVIVETDDPEATITVEGLPEGVEFNEETGEISGTPTTEGTYTVTVTATDENGNTATETFTITVKDPEVDNPDWNDSTAEPGEEIELPNNGGDTTGNETVEVEGPGEAHIDEEGNLVVTPNEDANPGDEVVVTVKDEDGEVIDTVVVTVEEPATVDNPDWNDGSGEPGEEVVLPNNGGDTTGNETVEVEGPGTAEIDEDGNLVVTPDEDANPGDEVVVTVKDEDGDVIDTVTVTVEEPANVETPDWNDGSAVPGKEVKLPNNGGEVSGDETVEVDGPGKAHIDEDGNLVVTPDEDAKPGDKVVVTVKDKDGNVIDTVTVTVKKPADGGHGSLGGGLGSLGDDDKFGSSENLKKCFELGSTASITNPLLWLAPLGLLAFVKIPPQLQAQMDAMAHNFNREVNKLGFGNNLPRFEVPAALNINTYLTPDQQRGLLGGALILAGLAATSAYIANGCSISGSSDKDDKGTDGSAVGSFSDIAKENAKPGEITITGSSDAMKQLGAGSSDKEEASKGSSDKAEAPKSSSDNKETGNGSLGSK